MLSRAKPTWDRARWFSCWPVPPECTSIFPWPSSSSHLRAQPLNPPFWTVISVCFHSATESSVVGSDCRSQRGAPTHEIHDSLCATQCILFQLGPRYVIFFFLLLCLCLCAWPFYVRMFDDLAVCTSSTSVCVCLWYGRSVWIRGTNTLVDG